MNTATMIGRRANNRKSLSENSSAAATQTPTAVLREKVSATATPSAGSTRAAHVRSRFPNNSRDTARAITIINSPE